MIKRNKMAFWGLALLIAISAQFAAAHPQNPYLKQLTVNGKAVDGFNKNTSVYTYEIERKDLLDPIPVVAAAVDDPTSTVTIQQSSSLPGEAKVLVSAIDVYQMGYVIKFQYKPHQIKSIEKVELPIKKGLELYRAPFPQRVLVTLDSGDVVKTPVVWNLDQYDASDAGPQVITGKLLPEADYNMKLKKTDIPQLVVTQRNIAKELYVSPKGNDKNPGTLANPFLTLTRAQKEVRRYNKTMQGDIIVYLRGGVYEISEPIQFNVADSGSNGNYVIYQQYMDEVPEFNGGRVLQAKWTQDKKRPGVYKTSLKRGKKLRNLFVDGVPAKLTETKIKAQGSVGEMTITGEESWALTPGSTWTGIKLKKSDAAVYANSQDVEIKQSRVWNSSIISMQRIYEDGEFIIMEPQQPQGAIYSKLGWGCNIDPTRHIVVRNTLENLKRPGQFYFDRAGQLLYYYPLKGTKIARSTFIVPVSQGLLRFNGESLKKRVENIEFSGITFCNDDYLLESMEAPESGMRSEGFGGVQNLALYTHYREDGNCHNSWYNNNDLPLTSVSVESAKGLVFEGNKFISLSTPCAVGLRNDVTESVVKGNFFKDIAGNTVSVGHPQHVFIGKDEKSDEQKYPAGVEGVCRQVQVVNNFARNVAAEFYQADALTGFFVEDCDFSHNDIADVPYSAISLGWGWVNFKGLSPYAVTERKTLVTKDNRVLFNKLGDTHTKLNDGGTLYVLGYQPRTILAYNHIYRGVRSLYPDQGSEGFNVHHNMLENPKTNWQNVWDWPPNRIILDNVFDHNYVCGKDLRVNRLPEGNPTFNTHHEMKGDYSAEAQAIIDNAGVGRYESRLIQP